MIAVFVLLAIVEPACFDERTQASSETERGFALDARSRAFHENAFGAKALHKIDEALVFSAAGTLFDDCLRNFFAEPFQRQKSEVNRVVRGIGSEAFVRRVHVRAEHANAHALAFCDDSEHFFRIAHFGIEHRRHVFHGEMRFEIARLIRDIGVAHGVRFVERVFGKRFPVRPNFFDELFGARLVAFERLHETRIFETTAMKFFLQLRHRVQLLFPHRFAKHVGLAARELPELAGKQHDLFLINRDPVSVFEIALHQRMVIHDRFLAVFAANKLRNVFHRTRTIQRIHGDEILETIRTEQAQIFFHAAGFELKKPRRFAAREHAERRFIVERDRADVQIQTFRRFHVLQTIFQNRERA